MSDDLRNEPEVFEVEQRSKDWRSKRLGRPTASQFHRIVLPSGRASSAKGTYKFQLLAERIFGVSFQKDVSTVPAVKRGIALEDEARQAFSRRVNREIRPGGFLLAKPGYGGSPDGYIGNDPVEIKCPLPPGQIEYLLSDAQDHWPQLMGHLLLTGAQVCYFWAYHPQMPAAYFNVPRDESYIDLLGRELRKFCADLDESELELRTKGEFDVKAYLASLESDR